MAEMNSYPSPMDVFRLGVRMASLPEPARSKCFDRYRELCNGFSWEPTSHRMTMVEHEQLELSIRAFERGEWN